LALALLYRAPPNPVPIAPRQSLWSDRQGVWAVLAAGLIYGLYNASLVMIFGFGPLMLTERGWTIAAAGSATSVALWLAAVSLPAGGLLADWTGHSSTILLAGIVAFAGALVVAPRADAVMPAFIFLGIVSGLPCGPIMSLPARVLAPQTRSVGIGLCFTV
jgi:MFS family permease